MTAGTLRAAARRLAGHLSRHWRRAVAVGTAAAVGAALVLLARGGVVEVMRVESASMAPTLAVGQRVLVDKLTVRVRRPQRGDCVVFRGPRDGAPTLKRVVGVSGDVVEIRDGVLHVDSRAVAERYVDLAAVDGVFYGPVAVPPGAVLVMGDNRGESVDSRDYGPVPLSALRGRARVC
ncbi:MAG TPA: signal peptidase I [Pilimelia sp.]|nr:signal peptidase I [Pilimelia sp.]